MISDDFYSTLAFADGSIEPPQMVANIKEQADDFVVDEIMHVECSGEGEHIWLQISKQQTHSDQIAKSLARIANIHAKDVGISGMKDFRASTRQWFSVWLPGVKDHDLPKWHDIESDLISIDAVQRHSRKLKRGTHIGNQFKIVLRQVSGDMNKLEQKLSLMQQQGVPNYFGEQRFGRGGSNLKQVLTMLESGKKIKQRQKRSMLLSSARSWLFNIVLSERLKQKTWLIPQAGEPLNLSGSRQTFQTDDLIEAQQRVNSLDIHTTAPLWGVNAERMMQEAKDLHEFELASLQSSQVSTVLAQGLEKNRLEYKRRSMRLVPEDITWQVLNADANKPFDIELNFKLGRGEFATSVLRELVKARLD